MTDNRMRSHLSDRLTSKRGAWVTLGISLLIIVLAFGAFSGSSAPARSGQAPANAESTHVDELLQKFPDADIQTSLVVATREDGAELTDADVSELDSLRSTLTTPGDKEPSAPIVSEDGLAAVLTLPLEPGADNTATAEIISELRAEVAEYTPAGLVLQITGGPAFGADIAAAFEGADFTLLLVTIVIVAVLLIVTYRSPILWLIPLIVIAIADGLAGRVAAAAGSFWNLEFDAGIVSVLVFGAGANYALLLISRYREELQRTANDREALSTAWRRSVPAILASNVTVVLALITLVFAAIPMTRGLSIPAALGLLIALGAILFVLPPVLAMFGRKIFWPFIPKVDRATAQSVDHGSTEAILVEAIHTETIHTEAIHSDTAGTKATAEKSRGGIWGGIATRVSRRPLASLLAGLALIAVMLSGLFSTSIGLNQLEKFRVPSESAAGLETLSAHFNPGEAQPIMIVANSDKAEAVVSAAKGVEGVVRADTAGESTYGTLTKVMVTSEYSPSTTESLQQIEDLRDAVNPIAGADAQVGGAVASDVDSRAGNERDLALIALLVLAVCFIVLTLLLRSLLAPILLLIVNLASALAAIGAGSWLSRIFLGQHALDPQVPILAFLFLVALGVDYTIFLVHRARSEAARLGTREGMVRAVTHTGAVITSAGIVLAAVFAALGVLPLVVLGQLGLIVGVGVLVDTLVVRSVIVPAIFALIGDRIWWPSKPHRSSARIHA